MLALEMGTSNARNKNLRPLFNTNIPPISGKYGLRNHFWSLESGFLMRKREENDFFSKTAQLPILSFWILNVHIIICQFQKRSAVIHFFSLSPCSCHMCHLSKLFLVCISPALFAASRNLFSSPPHCPQHSSTSPRDVFVLY